MTATTRPERDCWGAKLIPMAACLGAALLTVGCVATPQQQAVKEVRICAEHCTVPDPTYSVQQLRDGFQQFLKANAGEKVAICDSNPTTRACDSVGICQFVLGGIIPGNGCAQSITFSEIIADSQAERTRLKADMPLSFIGTPVKCDTTAGTFSIHSVNEISLVLEPRYCNWMVVGNMSATFNFVVESIDLQRGRIGGYWSHAVSGTGNGKGSGYAVLTFPKPIAMAGL